MDIRKCPIKYLDFHHTAGHEKNTDMVRQIHLSQGWSDIGYNIVIEPDGKAGIGRDPKYMGAHDLGVVPGESWNMNNLAFSISCIGNFDKDIMSETQYQGLLAATVAAAKNYNVPIERFRRHSDQYATACPGKNFPWERLIQEATMALLRENIPQTATDLEFVAPNGANIYKFPGGNGWVESLPGDNRLIIHLGRSTYISMTDGEIRLFARGKESVKLI